MPATASDKLIGTLYTNGVIHYGTGAEKMVRLALDEFVEAQKAEDVVAVRAALAEAQAKTEVPVDPADGDPDEESLIYPTYGGSKPTAWPALVTTAQLVQNAATVLKGAGPASPETAGAVARMRYQVDGKPLYPEYEKPLNPDCGLRHFQSGSPMPDAYLSRVPQEKSLNQVLYAVIGKSSGDDKDAGDWTQTGDGTDYPTHVEADPEPEPKLEDTHALEIEDAENNHGQEVADDAPYDHMDAEAEAIRAHYDGQQPAE